MKQENPVRRESISKPLFSHSTTPSRIRASSKPKNSPKPEAVNATVGARATTVPREVGDLHKARRSLVVGSQKGREFETAGIVGRSGNRPTVEKYARPRRPKMEHAPDEKKKQLQEKLDLSQTSIIKNLQSEVLALKADLDKAQSLNVELHSQNKKLIQDLAAAEARIEAITRLHRSESVVECQPPGFKDIQKFSADKLECPKVMKEAGNEPTTSKSSFTSPIHPISIVDSAQIGVPISSSAPPPPPPPPPRPLARAATSRKAPSLVEFYHSLVKLEGKKDSLGPAIYNKPMAISAHSSIVEEIQNRSAHLLAIKTDVETKAEFINGLIQKVLAAAYTNIEDVLKFVDWLDRELSSLADERAVLKHFNWPERKADAMREAAIEYRDLKLLESDISSYRDDPGLQCGAALKKMANLLDKSERSIRRLIKLRNSAILTYQDYKIPTEWMLDSGVVSKIKQASMKLAKMYMNRVRVELESVGNSERESAQEALLIQGVHFAYRAHQFAGGLDSETLCAFEEIRQRVPGHLGLGGCQQLLAGITSA